MFVWITRSNKIPNLNVINSEINRIQAWFVEPDYLKKCRGWLASWDNGNMDSPWFDMSVEEFKRRFGWTPRKGTIEQVNLSMKRKGHRKA